MNIYNLNFSETHDLPTNYIRLSHVLRLGSPTLLKKSFFYGVYIAENIIYK